MRIEKLHLDRAITASSTELTHVLVHWQRCLQGFRIPAVISTSQPVPDSAGWWPLAPAGQRINHYGCPTIKSQAPEPSSQSQSARRRWRPKSRRCDAGDGGRGPPMRRRRWRPRSRRCDAGDGGLRAGDVKFRATCSSSEREMWRVDEI